MKNRQSKVKKHEIHPIVKKLLKGDAPKIAANMDVTEVYISLMVNGRRRQTEKFLAAVAELVTQRREFYKNLDEIANQ